MQVPGGFDIYQTGPEAARRTDQALELMSKNIRVFARLCDQDKAYLLAAYFSTIKGHQFAYHVLSTLPSRFSPEVQQYLKRIKVIVSNGENTEEIPWIAENTYTHTTRRLEFLNERVATSLVPTMSAWLDVSAGAVGTVATCDMCP